MMCRFLAPLRSSATYSGATVPLIPSVMLHFMRGKLRIGVAVFAASALTITLVQAAQPAVMASVGHANQNSHQRLIGPPCRNWAISRPCPCPPKAIRRARRLAHLPAGDGWVELTLHYPAHFPYSECPGGIAIENARGAVVASAGYSTPAHTTVAEPHGVHFGVPSGSITTFVLRRGDWTAVSGDRRTPQSTVAFRIVPGRATRLTITLP
jgi:hypothetical protein